MKKENSSISTKNSATKVSKGIFYLFKKSVPILLAVLLVTFLYLFFKQSGYQPDKTITLPQLDSFQVK